MNLQALEFSAFKVLSVSAFCLHEKLPPMEEKAETLKS
jgi:hypothetical protein